MSKLLLAGSMALSITAFSQTTLFQDDFQAGGGNWTLNTGSGNNQWIVNAEYDGYPGLINDTPSQPGAITGSPFSNYLHIHNTDVCSFVSVCNANFDTGSSSNQNADLTTPVNATGYNNVSVSFYYLCVGAANSYGTLYYSIDGGSNWAMVTGATFMNTGSWSLATYTMPQWSNASSLKFRFNWQNGGSGSDPAFSVDQFKITGQAGSFASILTGSVNPGSWCFNTTANALISFSVTGTVDPGNVYTAQLSDASGSFAAPTSIGTLSSTATGTVSMNVTIPAGAAVGSGYRIRVVASSPATTGADNGSNLTVHALPNVSILANPADGVMCAGESVSMLAGGGVAYSWSPSASLDNPTQAQVSATPTLTTQYTVTATDANGCSGSSNFTVTVQNCLGVEEQTEILFSLYPNPANEVIFLQYEDGLAIKGLELLDHTGRLIRVIDPTATAIDVSVLPAGSYLVRLHCETGVSVNRFTRD